jgi:antitoxin (DNA-binding transcriptional repressor) of toxin-antitoxin stability system
MYVYTKEKIMEVGVRELRNRLSEIVNGNRPVTVTNKGRVVGEFTPATIELPTMDRLEWIEKRRAARARWKEQVPDWEERLGSYGLDSEGEPYDEPTFR